MLMWPLHHGVVLVEQTGLKNSAMSLKPTLAALLSGPLSPIEPEDEERR